MAKTTLYSKKLMANRIPKHSQSIPSSCSKDHCVLSYTYDRKQQRYRHPCSFWTLKRKSSFMNLAVFSCLYTEKTTCFILFSVLNIGLLHLSASPSSVFNTALLWGSAAAEECVTLPSELPELHASEKLLELHLSTHYREWTQIVTITAAWKMLRQKTWPLSQYKYAVLPLAGSNSPCSFGKDYSLLLKCYFGWLVGFF